MTWWLAAGQHRRSPRTRPDPLPVPGLVLAGPAAGDLTIGELRGFIADVDKAAAAAGVNPDGLRPAAAVRFSASVKGIWVRIPERRR